MARVKTGALIVVEKEIQCREYERTGIPIGAKISSQLLVNIFAVSYTHLKQIRRDTMAEQVKDLVII